MSKTKVIIDCDPGCDDAIALAAVLTDPKFDVIGITSIGGNVNPQKTKRNALGIADLVGRHDVPIIAGAKKPLVKPMVDASDVHGETGVDGLKMDFNAIANLESKQPQQHAVDFILEQSRKYNGELNLIVIGPMTNIAMALQKDKTLPTRIQSLTIMGGAFGDPAGNMGETLHAEFNVYCDPHAAKITLDAFQQARVPSKIMPLDVTHKFLQDADFREWLASLSPQGENFANMLKHYAEGYPGLPTSDAGKSPLHDFHTIASFLNPDMYTWDRGFVDVVPDGVWDGQTILSRSYKWNTQVASDVNRDQFLKVLKGSLTQALG